MRGQPDTYPRPAQAVETVLQRNGPAMICDNAVHNRQAEPCALLPCGHIGLQQPLAHIFGKAGTIVFNCDFQPLLITAEHHAYLALHVRFLGHALNRFGSVFQQIADSLPEQSFIAGIGLGGCFAGKFEIDVRIDYAAGEARLLQQFFHVERRDARFRHPCKAGELFDHPANVPDLTQDGIDAFFKHAVMIIDLAGIPAAQPFRRQHDRSQRVTDFMRDASCHIAPRHLPLRIDQTGRVVKCQDAAPGRVRRGLQPYVARRIVPADFDGGIDGRIALQRIAYITFELRRNHF